MLDVLLRDTKYLYSGDLHEQIVLLVQSNALKWSWKVIRMGAIFLLLSILKVFHNIAVSFTGID